MTGRKDGIFKRTVAFELDGIQIAYEKTDEFIKIYTRKAGKRTFVYQTSVKHASSLEPIVLALLGKKNLTGMKVMIDPDSELCAYLVKHTYCHEEEDLNAHLDQIRQSSNEDLYFYPGQDVG